MYVGDVYWTFYVQSNRFKWIALEPEYEYPRRQSIHLSVLYTLHCVQMGPGGSVAEWLACWTQAQKGLGSNRSYDAVG